MGYCDDYGQVRFYVLWSECFILHIGQTQTLMNESPVSYNSTARSVTLDSTMKSWKFSTSVFVILTFSDEFLQFRTRPCGCQVAFLTLQLLCMSLSAQSCSVFGYVRLIAFVLHGVRLSIILCVCVCVCNFHLYCSDV